MTQTPKTTTADDGPPDAEEGGTGPAAAAGDGLAEAEARAESRSGLDAEPPEIVNTAPFDSIDRYSTESLDRAAKAHLARFTLGISPYGLASTYFAWAAHLMGSPGKQVQLAEKAVRKAIRLSVHAGSCARDADAPPCIEPLPHDHRFTHESWRRWPYNLIYQNFLLTQQWWYNAARDVDGLSEREEQVVSFVARQILDLVSPSNFIATNPEVAALTVREGGMNLWRGAQNLLEDWERAVSGKLPVGTENYMPGRDVAVTPGKVVFRTHLLELIQYAPATETVKPEPILIVPAWIMKYYILDLSPHNSLISHLVDQGFTVFAMSWRNPRRRGPRPGHGGLRRAVEEALDAVQAIVPERRDARGRLLPGWDPADRQGRADGPRRR